MDFFMWGHLIILSLPGQSKDLMARLQAAVTMADANMLTLIRENAMLYTAVCLQMDRGNFKHLS